jgi:hypothetical protein
VRRTVESLSLLVGDLLFIGGDLEGGFKFETGERGELLALKLVV